MLYSGVYVSVDYGSDGGEKRDETGDRLLTIRIRVIKHTLELQGR